MKKTIITLSLIVLAISSYSQDENKESKKGFIGISLGPSLPLGDYADDDIDKEDSGLAKTGFHLNFNFSYKFDENFGIAALWTGNAHPVDVSEMADLFSSINPALGWEVKAKPWYSGALMSGLLVSFPFNEIDFDIRTLVGYSISTSPGLTVTASNGVDTEKIRQGKANATAFALNLGFGLRYSISEKLALSANFDYFSTKPEFEVTTTSGTEEPSNDSFEQKIDLMNISFGVGYRLK